jgi:hypothetical protein
MAVYACKLSCAAIPVFIYCSKIFAVVVSLFSNASLYAFAYSINSGYYKAKFYNCCYPSAVKLPSAS